MRRVPNAGAEALHTDAWNGYNHLGRHPIRHVVTKLAEWEDLAHVVMPEVHRLPSRRNARHRGPLFYRLVEQAVVTAPQPYSCLKLQAAGVRRGRP
jgi:hypothetical protein